MSITRPSTSGASSSSAQILNQLPASNDNSAADLEKIIKTRYHNSDSIRAKLATCGPHAKKMFPFVNLSGSPSAYKNPVLKLVLSHEITTPLYRHNIHNIETQRKMTTIADAGITVQQTESGQLMIDDDLFEKIYDYINQVHLRYEVRDAANLDHKGAKEKMVHLEKESGIIATYYMPDGGDPTVFNSEKPYEARIEFDSQVYPDSQVFLRLMSQRFPDFNIQVVSVNNLINRVQP